MQKIESSVFDPEKTKISQTDFFLWAYLQKLKHFVSFSDAVHFFNKSETIKPKKQPRIWASRPYVEKFLSGELNLAQILRDLENDFITFFDEYAAYKAHKTYYRWGVFGRNNASFESTKDICYKYVEYLAKMGQDTKRAHLEAWAAHLYEEFVLDTTIPIGSILVLTSPRGVEGDPHYLKSNESWVFFNIFVKTAHGSIKKIDSVFESEYHQLISFGLTPQLLDQHKEISTLFRSLGDNQTQNKNQQFWSLLSHPPLTEQHSPEHWLIAHPLVFTPNSDGDYTNTMEIVEKIKRIVQSDADQSNWHIKVDELPKINMDLYDIEAKFATDILIEEFEAALSSVTSVQHSRPEKVKKISQDLDEQVDLVRTYLLKWVEIHSENSSTTNIRSDSQTQAIAPQEQLPDINEVVAFWKSARTNTDSSKKVHLDVLNLIQLTSPSLLSVASLAHCTVLTPTSLAGQALKLSAKPALLSLSQQRTQIIHKTDGKNPKEITGVYSKKHNQEKKRHLQELLVIQNELLPISIFDRRTQTFETIYVRFSDQKFWGEYDKKCYRSESGVIMGPCDVDITQDNLILKTKWNGTQTSHLEEADFQDLLEKIMDLQLELYFEDEDEDESESIFSANRTLSNTEISQQRQLKNEIMVLIRNIYKKIFTITFSDLIAGLFGSQVVSKTNYFLMLPQYVIAYINSFGPNKLQGLENLTRILKTEDIFTIIRNLELHPTESLVQSELGQTN